MEAWREHRILITGAARRLGAHLAETLVREGAEVALHFHTSQAEAEALATRLRRTEGRLHLFAADLGDETQLERLADEVTATCGPLTGLVNNASVYTRTPLDRVSRAQWRTMQQVNSEAPIWLATRLGRAMQQAGRGSIVNVGDWSIIKPYRGYLPYTASKGSLTVASRALARELAPQVRVNVIAPGPMLLRPEDPESLEARIRRAVPLGRLGGPEAFTQAALFFLGHASAYCTGTVLHVDGGRNLA
ncbi:MAG: SDR family oxidoreductase [Candidatus Eisenbacteria bacterium]|nr:SDR family oxidoreductase [Candidatus Eisenbacteria bacterium]